MKKLQEKKLSEKTWKNLREKISGEKIPEFSFFDIKKSLEKNPKQINNPGKNIPEKTEK